MMVRGECLYSQEVFLLEVKNMVRIGLEIIHLTKGKYKAQST